MSYSSLLRSLVKNSNLSYKEIVEECKKNGTSIDKSYISKLINNKISPPSEEVSQVLETVLNAKTNMLVVESYFEKSPKPIQDFIYNLRQSIISLTVPTFNQLNITQKEMLIQEFQSLPILDLLSGLGSGMKSNDITNTNIEDNASIGFDISVSDNGLSPTIPIDSKVQIINCDKYNDGDILAVQTDEDEPIIVRRYFKLSDKQILLISTNIHHKPLVIDTVHLSILGKVISYKVKIE